MLPALRYTVLVYATLLGSQSVLIASAPASDSILSSTVQPLVQGRHSDYTYTPGVGAYKVHSRISTWNTARRTCDEEGAYLAIINSVAEAKVVVQLLNESSSAAGWVGVHDLYGEDEFVTIHGEPLTRTGFDVWRSGEPNNAGNDENCVAIYTHDSKLNDAPCDTRYHFICELPYVQLDTLQDSHYPEPTSAPKFVTQTITDN